MKNNKNEAEKQVITFTSEIALCYLGTMSQCWLDQY